MLTKQGPDITDTNIIDCPGGERIIDGKTIIDLACKAALSRKAEDITVFDVRGMTIITDYLMLASGTSDRHVKAIADAVLQDIKETGVLPLRRDGTPEAGWIVLDYADAIVHIFHAREREYYDLERLYRGAQVIHPEAEEGLIRQS
ncbi:MAG: ribosome silencing factor [Bacillota bacterium]|nr:ribosome silencing factor [Bacillota bacterium]MDI9415676.1 ribosome silencing factor [Bacillota bacterium]HOB88334.1 ribosome silencing factor [Bacillota bacterium]HOJ57402.1 ribosome silencing factor [Bacillota bacterium]HOL01841.1 ribosome silencing factor [Bacillota bacterium]